MRRKATSNAKCIQINRDFVILQNTNKNFQSIRFNLNKPLFDI